MMSVTYRSAVCIYTNEWTSLCWYFEKNVKLSSYISFKFMTQLVAISIYYRYRFYNLLPSICFQRNLFLPQIYTYLHEKLMVQIRKCYHEIEKKNYLCPPRPSRVVNVSNNNYLFESSWCTRYLITIPLTRDWTGNSSFLWLSD